MSWVPMKMKFPGKCVECGEAVGVGEAGLWLKGTGIKHERCGGGGGGSGGGGGGGELRCLVCGKPAGCPACEFSDACDTSAVSQLCMCYGCMDDRDTYALYRAAASRKFPGLEPVEAEQERGVAGGGVERAAAEPRRAEAAREKKGGAPKGGGLGEGDARGPRGGAAGGRGRARAAHGQLSEVDIGGSGSGSGSGRKRRGPAPGQQRL